MADDEDVVLSVDDHFVRLPESQARAQYPQAFVDDRDAPVGTVEPLTVRSHSYAFRISREMALDFGLVEPTEEERVQRAADLEAFRARQAVEQAKPGPEVTVDALLDYLRIGPAYAAHLLHPACSCDPLGDDPYMCDWATTLGFVRDTDTGRVVDPS